jgi:hypothetical protein
MTASTRAHALALARRGWPVFPCRPGGKEPATRHGFRDATTDPDQITRWWRQEPSANLAIATGWPGPDVLDVDQHGPAGNGFTALGRLAHAGLIQGASTVVSTPHHGLHLYFTGSDQPSARLRRHHLDLRAQGGYVLAPPSQIGERDYRIRRQLGGTGRLNWASATALLEPGRTIAHPVSPAAPADQSASAGLANPVGGIAAADRSSTAQKDLRHLVAWVAALPPDGHNRNDGLFWAACRAAEAGDETILADLARAARAIGLSDREISQTIDSARRTAEPGRGDRQAAPEAGS